MTRIKRIYTEYDECCVIANGVKQSGYLGISGLLRVNPRNDGFADFRDSLISIILKVIFRVNPFYPCHPCSIPCFFHPAYRLFAPLFTTLSLSQGLKTILFDINLFCCLFAKKTEMNILIRTQQLESVFSFAKKIKLEDSQLEILPFQFESSFHINEIRTIQENLLLDEFSKAKDDFISENKSFRYSIFSPSGKGKKDKAILLLHGLNERSWKKYLVWAEYLAKTTGKPVILFPIAFHMNRTPLLWVNPRMIRPWVDERIKAFPELENSTFVNIALSSRLYQEPLRFYTSGLETIYNLQQLTSDIKNGKHPLFKEDTSVHLFSYSIGALLSEILLLANPDKLFTDSRLFMFCGGSIFSEMNANARDIMDSAANEKLHDYYFHDFIKNTSVSDFSVADNIKKAFKAMIRPDVLQDYREKFFQRACDRIRTISLKADTVIPTKGIIAAIGKFSDKIVEEMDFPYAYSHQWPFPLQAKIPVEMIDRSFERVFSKAAGFL
jgi:hypothetical protein